MSVRIEYKCANCGNVFSPLSKKGFTSLHSSAGVPLIKCIKCGMLTKTNHKAYSDLNSFEKIIEWIKAISNALILGIIFGGMIGFLIGLSLDEVFPINNFSHNSYTIIPIVILITYRLTKVRRRWFAFSDKYKLDNGNVIDSDSYDHPDW